MIVIYNIIFCGVRVLFFVVGVVGVIEEGGVSFVTVKHQSDILTCGVWYIGRNLLHNN